MSIPFLMGFTPQQWQTAIDIMLEKDIGSLKIKHLHIIVIVESGMNAIMKGLGLPENAAKCSVLLNHNMKHHVKTNAGVTAKDHKRGLLTKQSQ
eukprot:6533807-Ditylum_brightwellii.AAC.2